MSKQSLRESILAADDLPREPIKIPEWNLSAFIKPLDGESRFKISQLATTADHTKSNSYIAEAYVCEGLVDDNGDQIFDFDDRGVLAKKNPDIIERIYKKVVALSGMSSSDQVDAEKK